MPAIYIICQQSVFWPLFIIIIVAFQFNRVRSPSWMNRHQVWHLPEIEWPVVLVLVVEGYYSILSLACNVIFGLGT